MTHRSLSSTTEIVLEFGGVLRHFPLPRQGKVVWWTPNSFAKAFAKAIVADDKNDNRAPRQPPRQQHAAPVVALANVGRDR